MWASDSNLLVQRQATFLHPVSYPPKVSNRVIFARILPTSTFLLTAAILKGCPLLRMRRGAGCWQPKRRLPPPATSNRLPGTKLAEWSTSDASYHKREKTVTKSGQYTYAVCIFNLKITTTTTTTSPTIQSADNSINIQPYTVADT